MVSSLKDTQFVLFARECDKCAGGGFISPATFANEHQSYGGQMALIPCQHCNRGYVFQKFNTQSFLKEVAEHVVMEMTTRLRGQWYDIVVQELETRIKDVELKIMGQQNAPAQQLQPGDRVALLRPIKLRVCDRTILEGTIGTVEAIHARDELGSTHSLSVLFGSDMSPPVGVNINEVRKLP